MNRGVPPTDRKARTGEFTPPGVTARARANSAALAGTCSAATSVAGPGRAVDSPGALLRCAICGVSSFGGCCGAGATAVLLLGVLLLGVLLLGVLLLGALL